MHHGTDTEGYEPQPRRVDEDPSARGGLGQDMLRVGEIMSQNVLTATPDDTVFSAAQRRSEQNVSCIVVTYRGRVVGLLTEKDRLNVLAGQRSGLTPLGVAGQMSSLVRTVARETLAGWRRPIFIEA